MAKTRKAVAGTTLVAPLDNTAEMNQLVGGSDYIKINENPETLHTFGKKLKISNNQGRKLNEATVRDFDATLPIGLITFISFEYSMEKMVKKLKKKFKGIDGIVEIDSRLYVETKELVKKKKPTSIFDMSKKTLDEVVAKENINDDLLPLIVDGDATRIIDGKTCVEISARRVVTATLLTSMLNKGADLKDLGELTDIVFDDDKVVFAIVPTPTRKNEGYITVNTRNINAINMSMNHETYVKMAEESLMDVKEGSTVSFVRTADLISRGAREDIFSRRDETMLRSPVIKITEFTADEISMNTKYNLDSKSMFVVDKMPAFLAKSSYGKKSKEIDEKVVSEVFGNLYGENLNICEKEDEPGVYLIPNIKALSLFAIFGKYNVPFSTGVTATSRDIAIVVEAIR